MAAGIGPRPRHLPLLAAGLLALAMPALAQQADPDPDADEPAFLPDQSAPPVITRESAEAQRGRQALLRGLDKVTGRTTDLPLEVGEAARFGRLEVMLAECRYPAANPTADAYAQLIVTDLVQRQVVFSGWMIASSPALSALDDARYDVWVISCSS